MTTGIKGPEPFAVIEYDLTDELACQAAIDVVEHRLDSGRVAVPGWPGRTRPGVILLAAALQIIIAIGALLFFGGWDWLVSKVLVVAGGMVAAILFWRAALYGLPSFARALASRRALRAARKMSHRRIRWLLYEDHLETNSASRHRRAAWTEVVQMKRCGQSMVLRLTSGLELVIPVAVLSPEVQAIIAARVSIG